MDLILVRCVVSWGSNEGKGEGVDVGGDREDSSMGPRRLSSTGFDPFPRAHAHALPVCDPPSAVSVRLQRLPPLN